MDIDISGWSRLVEVVNYAAGHNIGIPQAIEQLVNQGLSYEARSWLSYDHS